MAPRTVACKACLSNGCSRQEYWSGLPCPPPRDLPNPGIESMSLKSPALTGRLFTTSTTWEAYLLQFFLEITVERVSVLKKNNAFNLQSYLLIYKNRKLTAKKHIAPRDGIVSNNLQMWTGMKMDKDRHSGKWRKEPQKSSGQEIACSNWEENSSLIKEIHPMSV